MTKSLEPRYRQRLFRFDTKSMTHKRKVHKIRIYGLLCKRICYDERQITDKKKIFANNISDRGLVITKQNLSNSKLKIKKISNPIKKWAKMCRHFTKQDTHRENKHMKMLNITSH